MPLRTELNYFCAGVYYKYVAPTALDSPFPHQRLSARITGLELKDPGHCRSLHGRTP